MTKKIIIIVVVLVIAAAVFINKSNINSLVRKPVASTEGSQTQDNSFRIVSTKPDPLEEATIPPNGGFEISFNKSISELKIKTSPEDLAYEAKIIKEDESGPTFKINFKKPLELGSGVTFFILTSTKAKSGESLDKEYVYHIKTVGYTGV